MTYAWRSSSNGEKSELAKLDNEVIRLFSKCLQKKATDCQHWKYKFNHQLRCNGHNGYQRRDIKIYF